MGVFKSFDGWQEKEGGLVAVFTKNASDFMIRFSPESATQIDQMTFNMEDLLDREDTAPAAYDQRDRELITIAIKQFPSVLC